MRAKVSGFLSNMPSRADSCRAAEEQRGCRRRTQTLMRISFARTNSARSRIGGSVGRRNPSWFQIVTQYQLRSRRARVDFSQRWFAESVSETEFNSLRGFKMYSRTLSVLVTALIAGAGVSHAGDLDIHVILSGQVAPGVYGQVRLGSGQRPPPVVYAQPMLIEPQASPLAPVAVHVPPGRKTGASTAMSTTRAIDPSISFDQPNMRRATILGITDMATIMSGATSGPRSS